MIEICVLEGFDSRTGEIEVFCGSKGFMRTSMVAYHEPYVMKNSPVIKWLPSMPRGLTLRCGVLTCFILEGEIVGWTEMNYELYLAEWLEYNASCLPYPVSLDLAGQRHVV